MRQWLLLPAILLWFAATAWIRPLAMPDEGRYLSVAWEMLGGDWALPTLDGLPFFHKPPLFYWLAEAAMRVGGLTPFTGRLPSVVAAGLFAWAMYRFATRWTSGRLAGTLLVVLATTPYFYLGAQYANMDMLVAACIGATVLAAAHAVLRIEEGRAPGIALYATYAMAALGVLAKGLIGCALPAAIILAWLVAARRVRLIPRLLSIGGIALFLAIALPWPLAMQARYPGFLHYFIVEQHFHRFADSGFNNGQPVWFYVPVLFVLTLPWSLALPALRARVAGEPDSMATLRLLMVCWLGVVLVFFSIPHSKLIGYVLPAVPAVAWLCADAIASLQRRLAARHLWSLAAGTTMVLFAAVLSYGLRAPHSSHQLATVLAHERAAGEPVVFVDTYPFDLEFELHLKPPIPVVMRWSDASLAHTDSWQQALLDGAQFSPGGASDRLVASIPAETSASAGAAHRTWIVTPAGTQLAPGVHAQAVAHDRELALWKVEPP